MKSGYGVRRTRETVVSPGGDAEREAMWLWSEYGPPEDLQRAHRAGWYGRSLSAVRCPAPARRGHPGRLRHGARARVRSRQRGAAGPSLPGARRRAPGPDVPGLAGPPGAGRAEPAEPERAAARENPRADGAELHLPPGPVARAGDRAPDGRADRRACRGGRGRRAG